MRLAVTFAFLTVFSCLASLAMAGSLFHHPRLHLRVRYETRLVLPKYPVAIARDEIVDGVAQQFGHGEQCACPLPSRQVGQHRQRGVGFEIGYAAMDHRVGVGIGGVDAEG
jgi:hypothetical protein